MDGNAYRYTSPSSALSTTWINPTYVDTTWKLGKTRMGYGAGVSWDTTLPGSSTALRHYFRTKFCLSATRLTWLRQQQLRLKVLADNGADVYINGVKLLQDSGSNHNPVYWNNIIPIAGNNTAFTSGG